MHSLKPYNMLALESAADTVEEINEVSQLLDYQRAAAPRQLLVLGEGSNVVLASRVTGHVAIMRNRGIETKLHTDHAEVTVAAGENWHRLVMWTLQQDCFGLENLALIPGSAGAAPVQNIGAYGAELSQFLESVTVMELDSGTITRRSAKECEFGYRDSIFKRQRHRYAIVELTLRLLRSPRLNTAYPDLQAELSAARIAKPSAADVAEAVIRIRRRKLPDPARHPNVGSFFKNPVVSRRKREGLQRLLPELKSFAVEAGYKLAAAQLIDAAGWKNRSGRGVRVWPTQPLVLVNERALAGEEVLKFAESIRSDIDNRFGVRLEIEPDLTGFS